MPKFVYTETTMNTKESDLNSSFTVLVQGRDISRPIGLKLSPSTGEAMVVFHVGDCDEPMTA